MSQPRRSTRGHLARLLALVALFVACLVAVPVRAQDEDRGESVVSDEEASSDESEAPPSENASEDTASETDDAASADPASESSEDAEASDSDRTIEAAENADEVASEDASPEPAPPPAPRALPDYDGRPHVDPGPDAIDALLWVPRILTSPLYLIAEYLLRRPLAFLLTELERTGVLASAFSDASNTGLTPTLFYEFGLSPSIGVYAFWNQFLFRENRVSAHAAFFIDDWIRVRVRDRVQLTPEIQLSFRFEATQRPDGLIEGVGYDATQAPRARFRQTRFDGGVLLFHRPWRSSRFDYQVGIRTVDFGDQGWNGEPSIGQLYATAPIAFPEGYDLAFASASLVLDTHQPVDDLQTSRFRIGGFVEPFFGFGAYTEPSTPVMGWIRLGGELAGSTDFLGGGRVLMLRGQFAMLARIDQARIPFTELLDAGGGSGPMRGFVSGQLRGDSYVGVTLEYQWPVYALLDGSLAFAVGNAFGTYFEDFDPDRLRMSFHLGLLPRLDGEHLFEIGVGFGTETFERGAEPTSFRFTLGGRSGL